MYKKNILILMWALLSSQQVLSGNLQAGKQKAMVCAACHQIDGNSMVPIYPKIAGQSLSYLKKQLTDYRSAMRTGGQEGRQNAIMGALVVALSDQDIDDLSTYFSHQALSYRASSPPDDPMQKKQYELGKQLYRGGDMDRHIAACASCHGWQGQGLASAGFPRISGQNAPYLQDQLKAFRSYKRQNDMNHMMRSTAKKLTDKDIQNLTIYISTL
tara:strand:+ start:23170 stop:23811 length:642 start_codon:yes stop_codon:yes gene_type:complete